MSQTIEGVSGFEESTGKVAAWQWGICALMFASTVLNYMDRQAITLVGPQIKAEFGIQNEGFGWVMAAFSLSYAFWQIAAGYLVDRWNARWAYAGAVAWWSLAGVAAAFSPSLAILMACRALLGVGESFNWPCALRVTGTILPPSQRSLGNGIFNSGAAVGAVVAPLIITPLAYWKGWRIAFIVVASLGFIWVLAWLAALGGERSRLFAGRGSGKPELADELATDQPGGGLSVLAQAVFGGLVLVAVVVALSAYKFGPAAVWWAIALLMGGLLIAARVLPVQALKGTDWAQSLGEIVRLPKFWILVVVSISINICWHFLVNWLPTYLKEDRGMAYLASGLFSALPFLAADVGNLGGGAASWGLTRLGLSPSQARMRVMAVCMILISSGALVSRVPSNALSLVLLGLMALGTAAYMANYFAFCQEVAPRHTGFISGILGGMGNLVVAGFLPVAGKVKDVTGGFGPVFVVVGLAPWVGLVCLALGWRSSTSKST